jgi:hypothetical protein
MQLSLFSKRLAEACRARNTTETKICNAIGLSGRRAITLSLNRLSTINLYRVCQIADKLDVSTDWLLGRSNVMSVMEMPDFPELEPEPSKRKRSGPSPPGAIIFHEHEPRTRLMS